MKIKIISSINHQIFILKEFSDDRYLVYFKLPGDLQHTEKRFLDTVNDFLLYCKNDETTELKIVDYKITLTPHCCSFTYRAKCDVYPLALDIKVIQELISCFITYNNNFTAYQFLQRTELHFSSATIEYLKNMNIDLYDLLLILDRRIKN